MTARRSHILIALTMTLAFAALLVTISARRLAQAQHDLISAGSALDQTAREAREIVDLRAKEQTVESRQRPAQDVIAQVNAALAEIGIPSRHFKSLTPESGPPTLSAFNGGRLLQQSLRLVLEDLSPQQIGSFLLQWRSSQHIWTTSRIELVHSRGPARERGARDAAIDANRYDATLVLTAFYVADAPPPSAGTTPTLSLATERP
jgi:hypothetical protein